MQNFCMPSSRNEIESESPDNGHDEIKTQKSIENTVDSGF